MSLYELKTLRMIEGKTYDIPDGIIVIKSFKIERVLTPYENAPVYFTTYLQPVSPSDKEVKE